MTNEQALRVDIQDFIETYNSIVEEINDSLDGIRQEEDTNITEVKEINCMKKADLGIVEQDEYLTDLYLDIKRQQNNGE